MQGALREALLALPAEEHDWFDLHKIDGRGALASVEDSTITASLVPKAGGGDSPDQVLPGYTYQKAAGELWRSRFDADRNLVVINNGHCEFV